MKALVTFVAIAAALRPAAAQTSLTLADVLTSVAETHPELAATAQEVEVQSGRELAARAAFEPRLRGAATALVAGYYEYFQLAASLEQTLPVGGVRLSGGHRLGQGDIPDYYGERATRVGGELFAKLSLPLLANRAIDPARAEVRKARLGASRAAADLARARLALMRDAALRYWEWVAAGRKLAAAEDLLRIANERADQIRVQSASGSIPRIAVVDAERVLLARKSSTLAAGAEFARAQQRLSLFLRDADQTPVVAERDRVPTTLPTLSVDTRSAEDWIRGAVESHPEVLAARLRQREADVDLAQARNLRLPVLDVSGFVTRDVGAGEPSLGPTDIGVGVELSVPLWQRAGRGQERQARARRAQATAVERGTRDRIAASIRESVQLASVAEQRATLARERVDATRELAEAERVRLRQGTSDLLTVNLRELDVAAALTELIESELQLHRAAVELVYARGVVQ